MNEWNDGETRCTENKHFLSRISDGESRRQSPFFIIRIFAPLLISWLFYIHSFWEHTLYAYSIFFYSSFWHWSHKRRLSNSRKNASEMKEEKLNQKCTDTMREINDCAREREREREWETRKMKRKENDEN